MTRVYLNQVCTWSNAPFNILEKSVFFFFSINLLIIWTREISFFSVVLQIQLACSYRNSLIILIFIFIINQEFTTLYNICKGVSKEAVLEVCCRNDETKTWFLVWGGLLESIFPSRFLSIAFSVKSLLMGGINRWLLEAVEQHSSSMLFSSEYVCFIKLTNLALQSLIFFHLQLKIHSCSSEGK